MNAPTRACTIRLLGPGDLEHVEALLTVFGEAFGEPETYGAARPDAAYLRRLLARDSVIVFVALAEGAVVGGLVAYELPKIEQARSEIYLYDLAVAEPFRRQGIATALIEALRTEAAARGAWVIFVQADYVDPPAIALYEKLGTREEVLHFDIPVPGPKRGP
ncbi:AAC(3)-I family aminoglycoside N-acetyltransferase [Prosthecomicrobium sp. N25]|uniref:AAC(3)-I family aminoglycoside N-acetyltransferase n=1 Tax=Prosthecomicrobium sp. N25 TaxID=3129254 RepID=UPI0030785E46